MFSKDHAKRNPSRSKNKILALIALATIALQAPDASAIAIDLFGDIAKPLIGAAKDKAEGMMKYLWAQPYGGYAMGDGTLTQLGAGAALLNTSGIKYDGLMYGGRGGIELSNVIRIGIDYTRHFAEREERYRSTTGAVGTVKSNSINSMFGICAGFDFPGTPAQLFGARYFSADLLAESGTTGRGWGAGISFMLANPFLLIAEYRWLDFASPVGSDREQTLRTMKQYYAGLSFLLF